MKEDGGGGGLSTPTPPHSHLLGAEDDGDERLGLARLRRLVDEHLREAEALEAPVTRTRARRADDVRVLEQLLLEVARQVAQPPLVRVAELPARVLALLEQARELGAHARGELLDHVVEAQRVDGGRHGLAAARRHADDLAGG